MPPIDPGPLTQARCLCSHLAEVHEHYHHQTYCGLCGCRQLELPKYRLRDRVFPGLQILWGLFRQIR